MAYPPPRTTTLFPLRLRLWSLYYFYFTAMIVALVVFSDAVVDIGVMLWGDVSIMAWFVEHHSITIKYSPPQLEGVVDNGAILL